MATRSVKRSTSKRAKGVPATKKRKTSERTRGAANAQGASSAKLTSSEILKRTCEGDTFSDAISTSLKAFAGIIGFPRAPIMSDPAAHGMAKGHLSAKLAEHRREHSEMIPFKAEITFDAGVTSAKEPVIYERALKDQASKVLAALGSYVLVTLFPRFVLDHPSAGSVSIVSSCRALLFVPLEANATELQDEIRRRTHSWTGGVPGPTVAEVAPEGSDAAAAWLLANTNKPYRMRSRDGGLGWVLVDESLPADLALRQLELLSRRPLGRVLVGVGKQAQTIVNGVRKGLNDWSGGRVASERELPRSYDAWATWERAWREFGSDYLPIRTDVPVAAPRFSTKRGSSLPPRAVRKRRAQRMKRQKPKPTES